MKDTLTKMNNNCRETTVEKMKPRIKTEFWKIRKKKKHPIKAVKRKKESKTIKMV